MPRHISPDHNINPDDKALALDQSRDPATGRILPKINDDQATYMLERLSAGDSMSDIAAHMKVHFSWFDDRASRDPEFAKKLAVAREQSTWAKLERAEARLLDEDKSTGDYKRDAKLIDYAMWYAKNLNRKNFGDQAMFQSESITIQLAKSDEDWS